MKFRKPCRDVRWFLGRRRNLGAFRPEERSKPRPVSQKPRDKDGAPSSNWFANTAVNYCGFFFLPKRPPIAFTTPCVFWPPGTCDPRFFPKFLPRPLLNMPLTSGTNLGSDAVPWIKNGMLALVPLNPAREEAWLTAFGFKAAFIL